MPENSSHTRPFSSKAVGRLVGLILLVAAAVRGLYLVYPIMDSDQAITGLMARHILKGEFPIFFYGQEYCGSIEAYLVSSVFLLLGSSRHTLGLSIALISLGLVFLVYCLGRLVSDTKTGLLAALLAAFPSVYLVYHSVLARAAYIESPILGTLLLLLAIRVAYQNDRRRSIFLFLGVVSGLGVWTHFLSVYYLAPAGILLLINEKGFSRDPRVLAWLAAGVVLGGLPLWVYNTLHPLATWHQLQRNPLYEPFLPSLKAFFVWELPELFGIQNSEKKTYFLGLFSVATYFLYLAAWLYLVILRRKGLWAFLTRRFEAGSGLDLLLLFLLLFPLIFAASGFSAAHTSRYLVPLYPVVPIFFAVLFFKFSYYSRWLACGFLALVLMTNGVGWVQRGLVFKPRKAREYKQKRAEDRTLIRFLQDHDLRRVYFSDYWRSVPLTFDSGEEIIFAQPDKDRFRIFTRMVDRSPRAAYLVLGQKNSFNLTLEALGGSYHWTLVKPWDVYYDFSPPAYRFVEVVPRNWRLTGRPPIRDSEALTDGDLSTAWTTGMPMQPGATLELDLGRLIPSLGRVLLFTGNPTDMPSGLRLEISKDGRDWQILREIPRYWNFLFWSGPHPFSRPERGCTELVFPPQSGRFLRVTQTGENPEKAWTVAEVVVFQAFPTPPLPSGGGGPPITDLIEYLSKARISNVLAGPWLQAQIATSIQGVGEGTEPVSPIEFRKGRLGPFPLPSLAAENDRAASLEAALGQMMPGAYAKKVFREVTLFYPSVEGRNYRRLPSKGWRAEADDNPAEAFQAIDGKVSTRWSSLRPQQPGMVFRLDLGREERIARLRLRLGISGRDSPRGLELRVSTDRRHWTAITPLNRPVYWTGEKLFQESQSGETDLIFQETPARFLEIRQTGWDSISYWSIHELELFAYDSRP